MDEANPKGTAGVPPLASEAGQLAAGAIGRARVGLDAFWLVLV